MVLGAHDPDSNDTELVLRLRRYRCRACRTVITVAPRGILPRRRYCAYAIAWALALFGLFGLGAIVVRERVTSWRAAPFTANLEWVSLKRWARAVRDQSLFPGLPRPAPPATLRRIAQRAAMALGAEAPPAHRESAPDIRAAHGGVVISAMPLAA